MGRPDFTRTLTETTIKASVVKIVDGAIVTEPCEPFIVDDVVGESKAVDLAKKQYGKKQQYVCEVEAVSTVWAISKEGLKKYGHVVEPKKDEAGNKAE